MVDRTRRGPSADTAADIAIAVADAALARHRAEVELVAAIAAEPRRSFALLAELGVTLDDVANLDAVAVWLALAESAAAAGPVDGGRTIAIAAVLLRAVELWDDADTRPFVTLSLQWGPGSLARLLTAVPFDPATIRAAVAQLAAADRRQLEALAAAGGRTGVAA